MWYWLFWTVYLLAGIGEAMIWMEGGYDDWIEETIVDINGPSWRHAVPFVRSAIALLAFTFWPIFILTDILSAIGEHANGR